MRTTYFKPFLVNRNQPERAVFPVLLYSRMRDKQVSMLNLNIFWWAWSIGFTRTVFRDLRDKVPKQ